MKQSPATLRGLLRYARNDGRSSKTEGLIRVGRLRYFAILYALPFFGGNFCDSEWEWNVYRRSKAKDLYHSGRGCIAVDLKQAYFIR